LLCEPEDGGLLSFGMEDKRILLGIAREYFGVTHRAIASLDPISWCGSGIGSSINFFDLKPQYYSFVFQWMLTHMRR